MKVFAPAKMDWCPILAFWFHVDHSGADVAAHWRMLEWWMRALPTLSSIDSLRILRPLVPASLIGGGMTPAGACLSLWSSISSRVDF